MEKEWKIPRIYSLPMLPKNNEDVCSEENLRTQLTVSSLQKSQTEREAVEDPLGIHRKVRTQNVRPGGIPLTLEKDGDLREGRR